MKVGDRVRHKHKDLGRGTITEGAIGRRASAKEDPDPDARIKSRRVKWEKTGLDELVPLDYLKPLATFSESDMTTLKSEYPTGAVIEDVFIARLPENGETIQFTALGNDRVDWEYERQADRYSHGEDNVDFLDAFSKAKEFLGGRRRSAT